MDAKNQLITLNEDQEVLRKKLKEIEGMIDNPYSFSDRQFSIEEVSALAKTTIVKSDLKLEEIEWCLRRLSKIDQIDSMLPDKVAKMSLDGTPFRDKDGNVIEIDNIWKVKAKLYMLKRVIDRGIMSRTKEGWFIKLILGHKERERKREETMADILAKSDDQLEKEKGPDIGPPM